MIRKRRSQKEIPIPKTEAEKKEKAQSERNSYFKNRGGTKPNQERRNKKENPTPKTEAGKTKSPFFTVM